MFAYGSGLTATLFSFKVDGDLSALVAPSALSAQLADRVTLAPADFVTSLTHRRQIYGSRDASPVSPSRWIRPGAYHLTEIANYRRSYSRRAPSPGASSP